MGNELPKLYKRTSTGKIQEWEIKVIEQADGYLIESSRGQVGGKINSDGGKLVKEGKNLGKANETTIHEQALDEAQSKWKKKKDEGYFETIDEAENELVLLPMLAHPYEKRKHNIVWPAIGQPKLDGIRCLARTNSLMSRKGKEFPHLEHIREVVDGMRAGPIAVLDGELYSHDVPFEEITGIVRRETLKKGDDEKMKKILLNVYDCILLDEPDATFEERYEILEEIVKEVNSPYITLVKNIPLDSEEEMKEQHNVMVAEGYEGIMIRNKTGAYGINKRSQDLQKFKHFFDDEYKIVGFTDGEGSETGCIIWKCVTPEGKEFSTRPRGTREERQELFNEGDKYINGMLTVRFQELSQDNVPRFPVGIAVRDYE
jgi:ATP-dependent DNA ligase